MRERTVEMASRCGVREGIGVGRRYGEEEGEELRSRDEEGEG